MKNSILRSSILFALLAIIGLQAGAQSRTTHPRWLSDQGYWVIEGNSSTPLEHTVSFYNNSDELIYKETISGVKLDASKRRVRMKLKSILEVAVVAWNSGQRGTTEQNWVATAFRSNQAR